MAADPLDTYARSVVSGEVPAGKYHVLACRRHQRDRSCEDTRAFPYRFDLDRAQRFFRFAGMLKHYKGEWAGRPIVLQPHQRFRLGSLFGWVHRKTGLRRFRTAYNELPRKNGKSLEAATVALYVSFFDGEAGAEGYTIATKRDQAKIVFDDARQLVTTSIELKSRIAVFMTNLSREDTASKLEPLGADHDSTDGLNPNLVVADELHAYKDRALLDVMETATGARRQPVNFQITTAGDDLISPCGDQHNYACQILERVFEDESFFAFIAHADEEDDWLDERTWRKANPNYGVSVLPADLLALATKARHMPSAGNAFKQKRLNLWVNTLSPWLSLDGWRRGQSQWSIEELRGQRCWVGIDLSSKIDLTAVVLAFPPTEDRPEWRLIVRCLTPADTLEERAHRDRAPYAKWVAAGYLRTNPGNRIDQTVVLAMVQEAAGMFDVQGVGLDPWNAGNLGTELAQAGLLVVEIPQTLPQLNQPAKDFEADVLDGLVDAGDNELMLWCVSNAVVRRDGNDNIYPTKAKSRGRIDPVIAALMARKLATGPAEEPAADPELVTA